MKRAALLSLLVLVLLPSVLVAQAPERGGALPAPLPLFPRDNWWNTDISKAPVDANSTSFINFIGPTQQMHPDFGGDNTDDPPDAIYGIPYIVVSGSQAHVPVVFEEPDESDTQAPGRPAGYPIPEEAKTQAKWIEGGQPGSDPNAEGDRHMLIVDRDNRILYELYALRFDTVDNRWEAYSGAIFPLDSNARRPDTWTSGDAAGLAILPGLVRYDESFGSTEPIRHAFRMTVRAVNQYVFPASHRAGTTAGAPPLGTRLRLRPETNISGYAPALQRIFQAMKTYGLIVTDNGTDMYVTGTNDSRWDNGVLNSAFDDFDANDFEVIQLGWQPTVETTWFDELDLNGDGNPDQMIRNLDTLTIAGWMTNGNAVTSAAAITEGLHRSWRVRGTGDFNNDGKSDVLIQNRDSSAIGVWLMDGFTIQTGAVVGTPGQDWLAAGAADIDGDGDDDIIVRNLRDGTIGGWMMNGATLASAAVIGSPGLNWEPLAGADFDADGKADLLIRNVRTGDLGLWKLNGTTIVQGAIIGSPGHGFQICGTGDLNGDGRADIVMQNISNGDVGAWLMNGFTLTSAAVFAQPGRTWRPVNADDFNGDGMDDIVIQNLATGEIGRWTMNGLTLTGGAIFGTPGPRWELVGCR
jgi:hypothetical protein